MSESVPTAEERDAIAAELRAALKNGKLPCRAAFAVAAAHGVPPTVVGRIADELGIRISGCQLGCFP